ncbi:MAG: cadmium-translocating P-type ATPase [Treponema sp.]|nr:cadmium-translocating P-type ATPase [Treponema sp.]
MEQEEHTHEHSHEAHIHCACGCHDHDDHDEDEGGALKKILLAAVLFAAALLVEHLPFFAPERLANLLGGTVTGETVATAVRAFYIVLYLAAYLTCGKSVVLGALANIRKGKVFDEQFLMTIASLGAVFVGEFAEAVAVMLFYQVGEFFQDYAVDKSRDSISALMDIRPDHATVISEGERKTVHAEDVPVGAIIEIKPGERVPLDCIIQSGTSFVDTSALTGESVPREVSAGCEIMAGFVNTHGVLTAQVTKPYGESAVTRILELTEKAVAVKAKSEKFITRFAKIYTPIVCILAVLVALVPPFALKLFAPALFAQYGWSVWAYRALTFLVVSCPCALVISVPLSFFSGIGAASSQGILVKGSNYIEALAQVKIAVFDKTGTLTKGTFAVTSINPAESNLSEDKLLAIAAHAEGFSNHPISLSLRAAHSCPLCGKIPCKNVIEISGQGIQVELNGEVVLAGNRALMLSKNVTGFDENISSEVGTVIYIAVEGAYKGFIIISDEAKEDAKESISLLKKLGIKKTVMLTGDTKAVAQKVASDLGVDTVFAELLPQDKVSRMEALLSNGEKLLFVGDGINDSPVLARADVGIAMGALGSDAAIEAADVVIMDDKPSRLATAIKIARKTVRVVWQNIIFALGVKVAIMLLEAIGIANMWVAVFGDVGVAFLCVLNAMRLLQAGKNYKV